MAELILLILRSKGLTLSVGWMFFGTLMSIGCGIVYGIASALICFSLFGITLMFFGYLSSGSEPFIKEEMPNKEGGSL